MSKRFSNWQLNSLTSKKPKLDISIKGRDAGGNSNSNPKPARVISNPVKFNSENLFDDDDDDVILLASQNIEAEQRELLSQQVLINQESEISFSRFACEVQTSTQITAQPKAVANPKKTTNKDDLNGIDKHFDDDFDFDTVPFKVPELQTKDVPTTSRPSTSNDLDSRKANKERDCLESKIKYLTDKLSTCKEVNEKLTNDASEFNDKIQTKDGEVSMIRYQLRQLQQQNESLRLDKMQEIENIKKEWREKISELEKLVKSQESELEFKNVEIVNLKSAKLNDSQRHYNDSVELRKDLKGVPFLQSLHLNVNGKSPLPTIRIPPEIFQKMPTNSPKVRFRDVAFQRDLENIQCILSQLKISENKRVEIDTIGSQLMTSMKSVISGLMNYAQGLEFMKYADTNASVEYKFLCNEPQDVLSCRLHQTHLSAYQEGKLHPTEKAEISRRIVGGLAIACKYSPTVCQALLTENINGVPLLQVLMNVIDIIGFSKELFNHFGLLETLELLLFNFMQNIVQNPTTSTIIGQYLRSLIFCRPSHRPLLHISQCLLYISANWTDPILLNSLCSDSPLGAFIINEYYKIFQFSPASCTLQVYGALLETVFPQDVILSRNQIDNLLQICQNHLIFLKNCFDRKICWILKTENSMAKACDCYAKAINSAVILIHLVLKLWISDPKYMDNKAVAEISRSSVLFLYDAFHKNFRRDVLQNGGSSIKQRLQIIHDWFSEYKNVFQFETAHNYTLQSIKLSHIIADPMRIDDFTAIDSMEQGDKIWSDVFVNFV